MHSEHARASPPKQSEAVHEGEGVSTAGDLRAAPQRLAGLPLPVSLYQHTH